MAPSRIAVLECDTPLERTRHKYGGYGGVFRALLEAGAEALATEQGDQKPVEIEITKFDVELEEMYPKLENVDAVLITGSSKCQNSFDGKIPIRNFIRQGDFPSKRSADEQQGQATQIHNTDLGRYADDGFSCCIEHNSFDNAPWIIKLLEFTKIILAQRRVRLIGVCFGHQIIGRALGARVGRSDSGWELSVMPMSLTDKGKELFGVEDMSLYQMHRDVVHGIPSEVEQLAHSPLCENHSMYAKGRLITIQGHPEFTEEIVTEVFERRHASGIFDHTMYNDGMQRVGNRHDGVVVGKAFVKFALEG